MTLMGLQKPLLDEQAAEHAAAIERANALAAELATAMASRDALEEQVKSLTADAKHHSEEVSSLQTIADDLARQVQGLLRQIAILNDPSLASVSIAENATVSEGDIITDHLVEFKSIRALQEQNQKLLKLTRGLMAKLDAREISRATAEQEDVDTGASLDQATETIMRLHMQLLEAQKKINEATRERDFFSKLLARGEGLKWTQQAAAAGTNGTGPLEEDAPAPHQQTIEALRAEIDVVRIKAEEVVKASREEVKEKTQAVGMAEVDKARAEAKVSMLEGDYCFTEAGAELT
jgi:nucleoprotein TPR